MVGDYPERYVYFCLFPVAYARRLADRAMFLWNGEIVEIDRTEVIFSSQPRDRRTLEYVRGVFG